MSLPDIARFYDLLDRLETRVGGARVLDQCNGRMGWPKAGVYFFFEAGETRTGSGTGRRVVRVGTHRLKAGSQSTLWERLSRHQGSSASGGGNHRGSVFRKHVGDALAGRGDSPRPESWEYGGSFSDAARRLGQDTATIKRDEAELEALVTKYIGAMPFLWLKVDDAPGRESERGAIEKNSIGLLSQDEGEQPFDPPSHQWIGLHSSKAKIRRSGLWNDQHVGKGYGSSFFDTLEKWIDRI